MSRWFLRILNGLLTCCVAVVLLASALYAGFALWDNGQIYASAESVQSEMQEIRDRTQAETEPAGQETAEAGDPAEKEADLTQLKELFDQLQSINPDIGAWLTMSGTSIDYAVVQGLNNIEYVSKDVYGNFAIVGSIFLDSRNSPIYTDRYNLLYGHNMSEHRMFGDVNLYKEEQYFNDNRTGTLYLPDGVHPLLSLSIVVTNASDIYLFNPASWYYLTNEEITELVRKNALFLNDEGMEAMQAKFEAGEEVQILALSTCSTEFTDARTILLTLMDPWVDGGSK